MQGRAATGPRAVAAALAVAALTSGCAQWGALGVGGVLGGGLAGATQSLESQEQIEARPSLGEIFRDGRYEFSPMPRRERKVLDLTVNKDDAAAAAIEKLRAFVVVDRRAPDAFVRASALVFTESAADTPTFWDDFVRGFEGRHEADVGKLGGVDSVFQGRAGVRVLALRYAPDVVVSVYATVPTTRGDLEHLARYLLKAGR